ncbi:hypothetical protein ACROYT_G010003 [Oculina patagonica]
MNNNAQQAVIAIQEERARIGGVEVTKKTVIAATDEGIIAFEINTVEASGPPNPRPALSGYPMAALPSSPSPHSMIISGTSSREKVVAGSCCFFCSI